MADQQDLFETTPQAGLPARSAAQMVPFGQYKNQPYEVLLADPGYAMYLLSSMYAKLQSHHPALLAFLVNRYGLPDSTPAHNRLQNRFLDESFAIRFALAAQPGLRQEQAALQAIDLAQTWAAYVRRELIAEKERSAQRRSWDPPGRLPELRDELIRQASSISFTPSHGVMDGMTWVSPIAVLDLEFEKDGADVGFSITGSGYVTTTATFMLGGRETSEQKKIGGYGFGHPRPFRVEVKPIVGDDYPAILRAMKAVDARQLLVGEYAGAGATWDELVRVFELSGRSAVLLDDVENVPTPPEKIEITLISPQEAEAIVAGIYSDLSNE